MKFVVSLAVLLVFVGVSVACPPAAATCYQQQAQVYAAQTTVYQSALIVQPVQAAIVVPVFQAPVQVQQAPVPQQAPPVIPQVYAAPQVQYQAAVQFAAVQTYAAPYCAPVASAGLGYGVGRSVVVQREVVHPALNVVVERRATLVERVRARRAVEVRAPATRVEVRQRFLRGTVVRVR